MHTTEACLRPKSQPQEKMPAQKVRPQQETDLGNDLMMMVALDANGLVLGQFPFAHPGAACTRGAPGNRAGVLGVLQGLVLPDSFERSNPTLA